MNDPIVPTIGGTTASSASSPSSAAPYRRQLSSGGGGGGARGGGGAPPPPPRAAFVPGSPRSDLYGVVNCPPLPPPPSSSSASAATARLRQGPTLLEVRRIEYHHCSSPHPRDRDDDDDDVDQSRRSRPPLVHHRETTVLVSRGIPGLGGNVSSTCLDFRPHRGNGGGGGGGGGGASSSYHSSYSSTAVVRCATGLTSGALCVHSLHNLYGNGGDGEGGDAPSSAVEYYAPRQQRPATSVAWRPAGGNAGNLVAVGLAGSGGSPGGGGGSMNVRD